MLEAVVMNFGVNASLRVAFARRVRSPASGDLVFGGQLASGLIAARLEPT